eukprot:TRINITY_DN39_c1_g1_i1.p1 TRINITY_DN39_c1_g1~~TRINITY_DN39_c1_g1_i1.p1  ORF type:complete len:746 (-),score=103.26 TRINITY_DN39_c1_g1_i1:85-2322(-)
MNTLYIVFQKTIVSDFVYKNGSESIPATSTYNLKFDNNTKYLNDLFTLNDTKIVCVTHFDDSHFGTDVVLTSDLVELIVLGSRAHIFNMEELFLNATDFNTSRCYDHLIFKDYSFIPGRFAFQGDDWIKLSDNPNAMQIAPNKDTGIVLINQTPSTRSAFINATRGLLRSPPSYQFTTETNKIPKVTKSDSLNALPSPFSYHFHPCPKGSFNNLYGFATCLLCSPGSFQNDTGQKSCIKCDNTSYCPLGAILEKEPLKKSDSDYSTPQFNTYTATGVDSLVWTALFSSDASYFVPLYILWAFLIFGGIFLWMTKQLDPENQGILGSIRISLKNFYYWIDSDAAMYWDPVAQKFRDKATVRSALLTMALLVFLLLATIFVVSYFYEYEQYTGQADPIMNNARSSALKPYFTATDDEKALLEYVKSKPFKFTISLSGFAREFCLNLCTTNILSSTGCFVHGSSRDCHSFDPISNPPKFNCTPVSENLCELRWTLPDRIDLLSISSYTFSLDDVYVQEFAISISMESEDTPSANIDSSNTAKLIGCHTSEKLQLQSTDLLLFGISRQYDLTYVIQTSEQVTFQGSTVPSDYKMEAVIIPLQDTSIDTSTTGERYLGSVGPNTVTLQLIQPNYFVGNTEGRIYQSGQLFLVLVNIITGAIGIFDMFTKILDKSLSTAEEVESKVSQCAGGEEEQSIELSPRATTFKFNPYMKADLTSFLMEALEDDSVRKKLRSALKGDAGGGEEMADE